MPVQTFHCELCELRVVQRRHAPYQRTAVVQNELRPTVVVGVEGAEHFGPERVRTVPGGSELTGELCGPVHEVERGQAGWLEGTNHYLAADRVQRVLRELDEWAQP